MACSRGERRELCSVEREEAGVLVEGKRAEAQLRPECLVGAAQQGTQPRLELLDLERLGQIVVGTRVQAFDPALQRILRGEDQGRRRKTPGADTADDLEAAHPGQGQIDDRQIVFLEIGAFDGGLAVMNAIDHVVVAPQQLGQPFGQTFVVFDDQQPHRDAPPPPDLASAPSGRLSHAPFRQKAQSRSLVGLQRDQDRTAQTSSAPPDPRPPGLAPGAAALCQASAGGTTGHAHPHGNQQSSGDLSTCQRSASSGSGTWASAWRATSPRPAGRSRCGTARPARRRR